MPFPVVAQQQDSRLELVKENLAHFSLPQQGNYTGCVTGRIFVCSIGLNQTKKLISEQIRPEQAVVAYARVGVPTCIRPGLPQTAAHKHDEHNWLVLEVQVLRQWKRLSRELSLWNFTLHVFWAQLLNEKFISFNRQIIDFKGNSPR